MFVNNSGIASTQVAPFQNLYKHVPRLGPSIRIICQMSNISYKHESRNIRQATDSNIFLYYPEQDSRNIINLEPLPRRVTSSAQW